MVRYYYLIKGRVQGVGFRYRAYTIAGELGLTGWVRNRSDGDVEMEVQGDLEGIQRLMDKLSASMWIRMDSVKSKKIEIEEKEKGFQVVR